MFVVCECYCNLWLIKFGSFHLVCDVVHITFLFGCKLRGYMFFLPAIVGDLDSRRPPCVSSPLGNLWGLGFGCGIEGIEWIGLYGVHGVGLWGVHYLLTYIRPTPCPTRCAKKETHSLSCILFLSTM